MRRRCESPRTALYLVVATVLAVLTVSAVAARAETFSVRVSIKSKQPDRVLIEGERSNATAAWSFRNVYGSAIGIGDRIERLALTDASGNDIPVRKLSAGEYTADRPAGRFNYEMKLEAPLFESDAAHMSWLTTERGFLMLGDLLPLSPDKQSTATLSLVLPSNWKTAAAIEAQSDGRFVIPRPETAVLFVGADVRRKQQRIGSMNFCLAISGEWSFSDEDLFKAAVDLLKDHTMTFGGASRAPAMLVISPFPRAVQADHWSAETRGATVVLLSGKLPSKTAALAQLSYPIAHELFHLWVPNGLALDGEYDWFYEGFTLYQALRAGMRVGVLSFQDYLNAMGKAFDGYKAVSDRDRYSLLDASSRRWTSSPTLVYNKGMLTAFLYDLTLRQQSKGKRSLDDVYKELFTLYGSPESRSEGNTAVLKALKNRVGAEDFTRRYIENAVSIDLPSAIAPFGLEVDPRGVRAHISVLNSLTGSQRDLLRNFGYNEKTYGVTGHR